MSELCRFLIVSCAGALALAWGPSCMAQVQHCVTPDGMQVFTDRGCAEIGAVEQAPARPALSTPQKARAGGCARSVDDLLFEITGAFGAHDANRLANVYHWAGMGGDAAYDVMARLDAMVQRPLLDLVPVMPEAPAETEPAVATLDEAGAAPSKPAIPVGLRVEQTLANGITPSRTVFGLQKHFGCWWIKG
ncbi:hypothetical protein QLQ15_00460 [Lysobacter sp. LF1]|uniref:DUF4124 domain-containing protein n=1 Tax=Lysobacter stagni TaxID=3045172 RepID=A0ABT6XB65_9GAMM|nr:hypothetical protein [Lysobacter sp. LF1]MDI9237383.1 hypothetical protein [Lysobacter sp. LF1]